jgi:hypothetical protein
MSSMNFQGLFAIAREVTGGEPALLAARGAH